MDKKLFFEMENNLNILDEEIGLSGKRIFLFGHCSATLELIDLLIEKGLSVTAILDNSDSKLGIVYKGTEVVKPERIMELSGADPENESIVLITSRFYASMQKQLRCLGYIGPIRKIIDFNTYADYSLSEDTIKRMTAREKHGEELTTELIKMHGHVFKVFCPFDALGDVYIMMSYWESFARMRGITNTPVFCVPSRVLSEVIGMFGNYSVEIYEQKELDAMIQAAIYTQDKDSFIAHQDRPYVINLHRALYIKKIPLELIYRCGVFGLPIDTVPSTPEYGLREYNHLNRIPEGKSVVFSPYAKSVTAIDESIWNDAVVFFSGNGYKCFTNVAGYEMPLPGTEALDVPLPEMISVLEKAGTFIGIRSGLCDVVRTAKCNKIALYPDYNYSDTKWKAIDIYSIEGFQNIELEGEDTWDKIEKRIKW
ncbi:MAG: hypothetical protein J6X94_00605 [Lachnospiraceae bacterium]|nr:hypothetical protein [Lachnospiraceae bacterium]